MIKNYEYSRNIMKLTQSILAIEIKYIGWFKIFNAH